MFKENPFQEHPLRLSRKRLSRIIIALPTKKAQPMKHTSAIIAEHLGILIQIAISGQPLNKAIVCHLLGAKINSNSLYPLLENFQLLCYYQISMDSTPILIYLNKGLCKRKVLHPSLLSRRKKIPSDSLTFLISCMLGCCGLSQSSF